MAEIANRLYIIIYQFVVVRETTVAKSIVNMLMCNDPIVFHFSFTFESNWDMWTIINQQHIMVSAFWIKRVCFLIFQMTTANCVPITSADNLATNGVIHTVERVLPIVTKDIHAMVSVHPQLRTFASCKQIGRGWIYFDQMYSDYQYIYPDYRYISKLLINPVLMIAFGNDWGIKIKTVIICRKREFTITRDRCTSLSLSLSLSLFCQNDNYFTLWYYWWMRGRHQWLNLDPSLTSTIIIPYSWEGTILGYLPDLMLLNKICVNLLFALSD